MIEPTETESPETLEAFTEAMLRYAELAESEPERIKDLPNLLVKHLDEVQAAHVGFRSRIARASEQLRHKVESLIEKA